MSNLSVSDITQPITDQKGYCTQSFRNFCDELRYKINNVSQGVSTSIDVEGDLIIAVTNLYFNTSLWPLELPTTASVLYRDETNTLFWVNPTDLNLSPITGHVELFFGSTAPSGWVIYNGSIGNGASGGTCRANADTQSLFAFLWDNLSNTVAPVSSGRGASADDDFSANKTISLTGLAASLFAQLGANPQLTNTGANSLLLTADMLPQHSHDVWYRRPLDPGSFIDPNTYAIVFQDNLSKSSGYTGSIWSDEFHVNLSKYDPANSPVHSQGGMDIQQPSTNVNLIIKL